MTIAYDKTFMTPRRRAAHVRLFFARRLRQYIHRLVAAAIERREREAVLFALRGLSDRELSDMGLTRGEVGPSLDEAAQRRSQMQAIVRTNGPDAGSGIERCASPFVLPRMLH